MAALDVLFMSQTVVFTTWPITTVEISLFNIIDYLEISVPVSLSALFSWTLPSLGHASLPARSLVVQIWFLTAESSESRALKMGWNLQKSLELRVQKQTFQNCKTAANPRIRFVFSKVVEYILKKLFRNDGHHPVLLNRDYISAYFFCPGGNCGLAGHRVDCRSGIPKWRRGFKGGLVTRHGAPR